MLYENLESCCGSCQFIRPLSPAEFIQINQVLVGMRNRPYTDRCYKLGLLVSKEDLPCTTRFPEKTFPNPGAETCYSPANLSRSKSA